MNPRRRQSRSSLDNSTDKCLLPPPLDFTSLTTFQTLQFRSQKCVSHKSQEQTQPGTCPRLLDHHSPPTSQPILLRLLLTCIELQRQQRQLQTSQQLHNTTQLKLQQLTQQLNLLQQSTSQKSSENGTLREQSCVMGQRVKQLQQRVVETNNLLTDRAMKLQEKDRAVGEKDRQISQLRLEIQNYQRRLEKAEKENREMQVVAVEVELQKAKVADLMKRNCQLEERVLTMGRKEQALHNSLGTYEARVKAVDEELQGLRGFKIKACTENQQFVQTLAVLKRENQQISLQNSQNLEKLRGLERELAFASNQLKNTKESESEALRKHFSNLQNRLNNFGATVIVNTKLDKDRQIQHLLKQRDSLTNKILQLTSQLTKLQKLSTSDCKSCQRLTSQTSLLQKRIGVLSQSLKQRQLQLTRQLQKPLTTPTRPSSTPKINMRELLQTAETIRGSNVKMSHLLDISNVEGGKGIVGRRSVMAVAVAGMRNYM